MSSDAGGEGASVPVGWAVDDPVSLERFGGGGGVAEVQGCIALHVAQSVLARARVNAWRFAVNGQIKTVSERAEAIWVGVDLILQEVAQKREGGAVGSLRVGRYVNGGDNETTREVAANAQHGVLDVF